MKTKAQRRKASYQKPLTPAKAVLHLAQGRFDDALNGRIGFCAELLVEQQEHFGLCAACEFKRCEQAVIGHFALQQHGGPCLIRFSVN